MTAINLEDIIAGPQKTTDSQLVINMPTEKLAVGKHVFQLTVTDNAGNVSQPDQITVIIVDKTAPTAVLELRDSQGRPVTNNTLAFGVGFILDGKLSTDIGGTVASYQWEMVS